jgi:hypothetical protein
MATPKGILCSLPFTFVGHEAFPLFENLLKSLLAKTMNECLTAGEAVPVT